MKTYSTPSVEDVRSCITPVLVAKGEDPEFQYTDAETDRQFSIRQMERGYAMFEARPNGRAFKMVNGHSQFFDCEVAMALRDTNPNGFRDAMRERGISNQTLVFDIGGYCLGLIVHDSLEDCAAAIVESIKDNTWYLHYELRSDRERVMDARQAAVDSHHYWKGESEALARADIDGTGLFAGTCNGMGKALDQEARQRVLAYLNAPSQEAWLDVRNMLVTTVTTLWLAWCEVDRNAPISGEVGYPDADTVRRAIRHAVEARRRQVERKLAENPSPTGLRVVK